jgi:hypothetical protein
MSCILTFRFHNDFDPLVAKFEWLKKPYRLSIWTLSGHLNTLINGYRRETPIDYRRSVFFCW